MKNKLVIVGTGETAMLAYEYFTHDTTIEVVAFAVDPTYLKDPQMFGLPVISLEELQSKYSSDQHLAFVAMGAGKLNRDRSQMYCKLKDLGYECASYISSRAFVWQNVKIGENCFILEDNTLQPFTEIGDNVYMWSGNHLGHRSVIQDNCFVSSHCVISGFCRIGTNSFLGVNCTIEDGVEIAPDNFVGAGAIVRKNTKEKSFFQEGPTEVSKIDTFKLFRIRGE